MTERLPIFTVGHSTRTIPEFVELLRAREVQLEVDVCSVPRSRTNPQYNLDALPDALAGFQIGHMRIAELGGLRKRTVEIPAQTNGYWIIAASTIRRTMRCPATTGRGSRS